jgi:motility quorum-sensing regulator/GCU-specific mRNA interferase toxin
VEKRKPAYDLARVVEVLGDPARLAVTKRALRDAQGLGFGRSEIAGVIRGLDRTMFYKSMTSYADHRVWQDVYHVPVEDIVLYVKVQGDVVTDFLLLSFKEK